MLLKKLSLATIVALSSLSYAHASGVEISGTRLDRIETYHQDFTNGISVFKGFKSIQLLQLKLSPTARHQLQEYADIEQQSIDVLRSSGLASMYQNNIDYVPVQDQGDHGTCATFANSAAIDAALHLTKKGNDSQGVSELCTLQLGVYLSKHLPPNVPYYNSGWVGTQGAAVLKQNADYGFMTKAQESFVSPSGDYVCNASTYPVDGGSPNGSITPTDFTNLSNKNFTALSWQGLFAGGDYPLQPDKAQDELTTVKEQLTKGNFVTVGIALDPYIKHVGAIGTSSSGVAHDSWVSTPQIIKDVASYPMIDGHELLITGYDDNACATFNDNGAAEKQCGLLTLRNSWGPDAGDHGSFYMSYDYFKLLTFEAQLLKSNKPTA